MNDSTLGERRTFPSTKKEAENYISAVQAYLRLEKSEKTQEKLHAVTDLTDILDALEFFLETTTKAASRKPTSTVDSQNPLYEIAQNIKKSTDHPHQDNLSQVTASEETQKERQKNVNRRVMATYRKIFNIPEPLSKNTEKQQNETQPTDEQVAALQDKLMKEFADALDSTLPQLTALLTKAYPNETKEKLTERMHLLLRGLSRFVRAAALGKAEAQKSLGIGSLPTLPEMKSTFVELTTRYLLATSPIFKSLALELPDSENIDAYTLDLLKAQLELNELLGRNSDFSRMVAFKKWIIESKRSGSKVAGSPADKALSKRVIEARKNNNRVAGVILYGPPGTGKTEQLIYSNRQEGFDTVIIPMHQHSDFAQLMGEAPIFLSGLADTSSKQEKITAFKHFIEDTNRLKKYLADKPTNAERLLNLVPTLPLTADFIYDQAQQESSESITKLSNALSSVLEEQLVAVYLGEDKEALKNWVDGQILQAMKQDRRVVLDEADKAPGTVFDGISAVLAKNPGETILLGGEEVKLPHWFHIDMSVNSTELPTHVKDRFSQIKLDYTDYDDMFYKLGIWLTDENGDLTISKKQEQELVLFFTHVVPRIQKLYEQMEAEYLQQPGSRDKRRIMQPLTLRGMFAFCQRIKNGDPISSVIDTEILAAGALAEADTKAMAELIRIIGKFNRLTERHGLISRPETVHGAERTVSSPLYRLASEPLLTHQAAEKKSLLPFKATEMQRKSLAELDNEQQSSNVTKLKLKNGVTISVTNTEKVAQEGGGDNKSYDVSITYSYISGGQEQTFFTAHYHQLPAWLSLTASDIRGEVLIGKLNGSSPTEVVLTPIDSSLSEEMKLYRSGGRDNVVSPSGTTIASIGAKSESLAVYYKGTSRDDFRNFNFTLPQGQNFRRHSLSEDGKTMVVESDKGKTYLLFLDRYVVREAANQQDFQISESQQIDSEQTDRRITGDIIWSKNSSTVIKIT